MEETQGVVGSAETGSPSRGPSGKLLLLFAHYRDGVCTRYEQPVGTVSRGD